MEDFFVEESVGDRGVVQVWAVPHEFVGKVVFVVDNAAGNAASCVANNVEIKSAAQVMLMKLHLLFNKACNCSVLLGGYREVMSFVPPLDRCKEASTEVFGRRKESAFAGVPEEVVLWDQSEEGDGDVAVENMSGVCLVEMLTSALGWLLWFPLSVELSPVVNTILYSWVSCEDYSGGRWV